MAKKTNTKTKTKTTAATAKKATNVVIKLQSGSDNTLYATWKWDQKNTDKYEVEWRYYTPSNVWFSGSESSEKLTNSTYSPPSNASRVSFRVKPVAKTQGDKKKTPYWNAEWTSFVYFEMNTLPLEVPPVPEVSLSGFTLTAELDIYGSRAPRVEFQVVKDDRSVVKNGIANISTNHASFAYGPVAPGGRYKVRARAYIAANNASAWSEYSESITTIPAKVAKITSIKTIAKTQGDGVDVQLTWNALSNVTEGYTVEYTTNKAYFGTNPSGVQSQEISAGTTAIVAVDSNTYQTYYFRVRGKNDAGEGGWSPIAQITIGMTASAPTTWSYTTTVKLGEGAVLNWQHNCADGSDQTKAEMQEWVNGGSQPTRSFTTQTSYTQGTGTYRDGTYVTWRVRTAGANKIFGPWSTIRRFDVIQPPVIELGMYDAWKWKWNPFRFPIDTIYTAEGDLGNLITTVKHFPIVVVATALPASQNAISFNVDITPNESYETYDNVGQVTIITAGESIYSKFFPAESNTLKFILLPGDINLENNISYTMHIVAAMDSGLTAEADYEFDVDWEEDLYVPDAFIYMDDSNLAANIQPFCTDPDGNPVYDVTLSVYRREYNGRFTLIQDKIPGPANITVVDPHPSLDYARYRIVAMSNATGLINYYDIPALELGFGFIVMQWDEEWTYFDTDLEEELADPAWSGSMLKLPYNVDVTADQSPDVALVNYIGREHPVSYYGTHKGETARWQCEVPKMDSETLYALRRLAAYSGDVYVREPSGIGYWAQVGVSYSINHNKPTVPVTFTITRVEGGV